MKLGQAATATRGSFGIPPEMHPDRTMGQQSGRQPASPEGARAAPPVSNDDGFEASEEDEDADDAAELEEPQEDSSDTAKTNPKKILAEMGVTLTGQDWSDFIFKGYMEKRILIAEIPSDDGELRPFYATFRTVTGEQADAADGLLAEEVRESQMTVDGVGTRREMWNLSFAIQKLDDKAVCKTVTTTDPKTKETKPDLIATVKEKRKLLSKMAPMILQTLMSKYWTFLGQVKAILENPKSNFLEKP